MKATLTLAISWLLSTAAFIAFNVMTLSLLPGFVVKAGPFLIAGWITGRFPDVSGRARLIAALVLALFSAVAWTAFSVAASDTPPERALLAFAVSLPIHFLGAAWAYFGMWLGSKRSTHDDAELAELEREIKKEMKP